MSPRLKIAVIAFVLGSMSLGNQAYAASLNPGQHFIDPKTGYPCEPWRENNGGAPEDKKYCQGIDDTQQRLYELENIIKIQDEDITMLKMKLVGQPQTMIGPATKCAEQTSQPTMSPEMQELFAAFESRLQKLEKLFDMLVKAVSFVPGIKSHLVL